jgi:D-arabinose 1-dehydrogenase-like Zn-dependent alcohol dehydrogenase
MTGSRKEVQEMLQFVAKHRLEGKSQAYYGLTNISNLVNVLHSEQLQGKGIVIVDKEQV